MRILDKLFRKKALTSVPQPGWVVQEPFTGAWQRNMELRREDISSFFAVFACVSKISQDVAKLPLLIKEKRQGIWETIEVEGFEFLKKPNHYQTTQQFIESWANSKMFAGNTYIFKSRDVKGDIDGLYPLNPQLVKPLVDDDGAVFYQIGGDKLNKLGDSPFIVPASEIIHDRWNCFYHPLVGLSPLVACGVAAGNGLVIQKNSSTFFANNSRPSGVLIAPGHIAKDKAKELQDRWNSAYNGENRGKTALISDGMQYQQISMSAADAQLIEQLRLSAEIVCSAFKMPPFLIGFGAIPAGLKVSDLNELYYSSCLQTVIEAIENLLTAESDAGILDLSIEFDLDALIRMDPRTQMEVLQIGTGAGLVKPNEGRAKLGLGPVEGGDTPYLQQQNYSLSALAKRDQRPDPFSKGGANAGNA